jgi:hypothetical protein
MGANDGSVLAFRQLLNNGANNLRYNIVLVSEGYTQAEIPLFQAQCKSFVRKLFWTAPYTSLRCTLNVFALEVSSTASGIDDPLTCGDKSTGSGAMPATFFDSSMCGGGSVRRVIAVDGGLARNRVAGFLPQANSILVLCNTSLHGGVQGDVAVFTTEPGWEDTALHEYGHVMGLADEYGCYVCDGTDSGRTYDWFDSITHGYGLPDQPNVSVGGSRAGLKWGSMVLPTTPVPTTAGSVPSGTVGMFVGAKYYDIGLFRPEQTCAMKATGAPFCAVCSSAITTALAPWTPTTTCVVPTANPASVTLDTQIRQKFRIATGRGGYEVLIAATTNLPPTPTWAWRPGAGNWLGMPANRTVRLFINDAPGGTYIYDQAIDVRANVTLAELDYWVPGTSAFTTATATDQVALREPDNAANRLFSDYANAGNVAGPGTASLNIGRLRSGNGRLYLGTRMDYTRLAMTLELDGGYFGPKDDPAWALQNITWTPSPTQSAGLTAFYDVTFGPTGLCWLTSAPATVVDPAVGFAVSVTGKDSIGQSFSVTGRLIPTNVEYRQSISTIEHAKIPKWEWPVQIEMPENVLETVVDGAAVTLTDDVLKIDDLKIELKDAHE